MKNFSFTRRTKETTISVLIPYGNIKINVKVPFLKHILEQLFFHSGLGVKIKAKGDIDVDYHHVIEDLGICLGKVFRKMSKYNILKRFSYSYAPLDESLSRSIIDVSGRGGLYFDCNLSGFVLDKFDSSIILEFFRSFALNSKFTIHISSNGNNVHHKIESIFKSFGLAIKKIFLEKKKKRYIKYYSTK